LSDCRLQSAAERLLHRKDTATFFLLHDAIMSFHLMPTRPDPDFFFPNKR
jgi:hypothetical protein